MSSISRWLRAAFAAGLLPRSCVATSSATGPTAKLMPLLNRGKAVRFGLFSPYSPLTLHCPMTRLSQLAIEDPNDVSPLLSDWSTPSLKVAASERNMRMVEWSEKQREFVRSEFAGRDDIHQPISSEGFTPRIFAREEKQVFLDVIAPLLYMLVSKPSGYDYMILAPGDDPIDGYVQFKSCNGKMLFGESQGAYYKKSHGEIPAWHSYAATKLGWLQEDGLANNFGVFECVSAEEISLLAELAIDTLTSVHGLTTGSKLTITYDDCDGGSASIVVLARRT